ncbi:MAG: hypothetical protein JNM56_06885 [Planctomycetia bacterium]|nr:hypothetical protein [Planctomycetia bacterium]
MRSLNIDAEHAVRSAELAVRWDTVLREFEHTTDGANALAFADDMDALLEDSTDSAVLRYWRLASGLLRALAVNLAVNTAARVGGTDVASNRIRLQVLLQEADEIVGELDDKQLQESLRGAYDAGVPHVNKNALLPALAQLPLPTLYLAEEKHRWPRRSTADGEGDTVPKVPVLRLTAFLDNTLVAATQQLRPHTLHTLRFDVRGTEWPDHAQRLRVELLSTCPPSLFHVSIFETGDRSGAPEFEATLAGSIQFTASQSEGASDLVVAVRAGFTMQDGSVREAHIVGHSQLRFRVSSSGDSGSPGKLTPAASAIGGLSAGQFGALQNSLLGAFNRESLRRILRTKLDVRLDHIAGNGTFTDIVCDVIDWAEREGRVDQLVREAAAFVPGNEELQRFASEFERMKTCR